MQRWLKSNLFTLGLILAVLLALLFPGPAAAGGWLHSQWSAKAGVAVIFLLLGLSLPLRQLSAGYRPLRLQLFVPAWNFLGVPLLVGLALLILGPWVPIDFRHGFVLLAMMPTTIASAVTFTQLAGGQTAPAILASVISNVLALLLVPALCVLYFRISAGVSIPLVPLLLQIGILILLPLLLGQILRRCFSVSARSVGRWSRPISQGIILFIVHAAFANSVQSGELVELSVARLCYLLTALLLLLCAVSGLVWLSSGWLRLPRSERIAAFYCASQKSIATGLPLAAAVLATFSDPSKTALILIPLILYHPLQLLFAGLLVARLSR